VLALSGLLRHLATGEWPCSTWVDADVLTTHNLNRVSYASLAGAISGALKVDEAVTLLKRCCRI